MRIARLWAIVALTIAGPFASLAGAETLLLHCGVLITDPRKPAIEGATIAVRDGRIEAVLSGYSEPGGDARVIDLRDRVVMPGLIDCHTHITFEMDAGSRLRQVQESDADAALRGAAYAERTLDAGFTTIRNVGSDGDAAFALRDAIARGDVSGPRILCAGAAITPTGGHGDTTHGFREDLIHVPGAFEGVADGVDACREAVRAQVKRGADVIKLTATGGVLSVTDAGTGQQFFDDELEAIVITAHSLGRRVAAHAHGADGLNAALRAGVDSIEHGSFLNDESITLLKETGAYLVPTVLAGVTVTEIARSPDNYFPPPVREKALAVGPVMLGSLGRAYEQGVNIAFGTDSGVSPHGENARELELMVEAGMPNDAVLTSATANAADLCGLLDEVGTIEPGKIADIIALNADPREDITTFRSVPFVMARGVVHKHD
jgi:imidazolonepropionase-like amidohydrolase